MTDEEKRKWLRYFARELFIAAMNQSPSHAETYADYWYDELAWLWEDNMKTEQLPSAVISSLIVGITIGAHIDRNEDGSLNKEDSDKVMDRVRSRANELVDELSETGDDE